ncbi:hypothetical protein [Sediminicola luteus]|uniref:Macroglobulin domain-containing protein n=1 Tax=Sediminicola luteus TaxID=319238 RepID=A0A2A4GB88_9FLAO|nr:hypothetical protein [Sediminicola luteus]PCE65867.1 hypothetical protein B7P33_00770 [Sediminicola luteus]
MVLLENFKGFGKIKRVGLLFGAILLWSVSTQAQAYVQNQEGLDRIKKTPLETIYAQTNTSLAMPGEYVYFSIYCLNAVTHRLSDISKVGYIELIDAQGQSLIQQRIRLKKGLGKGELFIPTSFGSGNYKLIAYTHWMLNAGIEQLYQKDLVIVNPYQGSPENFTSNDTTFTSVAPEAIPSSLVGIDNNKGNYGPREKIALTLRPLKSKLSVGSYTLSVRELAPEMAPPTQAFTEKAQNRGQLKKYVDAELGSFVFIPETRGALVAKKVTYKDTGEPVKNQKVLLSLPGTEFGVMESETNETGVFFSYVRKAYDTDRLVVQLADTTKQGLVLTDIRLDKKPSFENLTFSDYKVSPSDKTWILSRSVANQIENAYIGDKKDTLNQIPVSGDYANYEIETYLLDDYNRFPTVKESLIEVVPHVGVKIDKKWHHTIWIRENYKSGKFDGYVNLPPLIYIDGVLVFDVKKVLEFDAEKVKSIGFTRERLQLGGKTYKGALFITTKSGDYNEIIRHFDLSAAEYPKPLPEKRYYQQAYGKDPEKEKRIPDFRRQLFWKTHISLAQDENIEFFSSDAKGTYELRLEGFTDYGKPVTMTSYFEVK